MRYETKIAIIVKYNLLVWQKLNVSCFLAGGLAGAFPEIVGEPFRDGDETSYTPLIRQPVLIFETAAEDLRRVHVASLSSQLTIAIYPEDLFRTNNDPDNRAAVAALSTNDITLVGLGIYGTRRQVDKLTKGLSLAL